MQECALFSHLHFSGERSMMHLHSSIVHRDPTFPTAESSRDNNPPAQPQPRPPVLLPSYWVPPAPLGLALLSSQISITRSPLIDLSLTRFTWEWDSYQCWGFKWCCAQVALLGWSHRTQLEHSHGDRRSLRQIHLCME